MESRVSSDRLSLPPYCAAQHPVQCRLQALVGSMRMAQGTLQSYLASIDRATSTLFRLELIKKHSTNFLMILVSTSAIRFLVKVCQMFSSSVNASRITRISLV